MSEKPLLLSPAKSGVLVRQESGHKWLIAMVVIGLLVVIVGAADITSRFAHFFLGDKASLFSFAPAIAVVDPSVLNSFSHATQATSTAPLIPVRITIPSIGVDAKVEQVGKKSDGTMGTPSNFTNVAWYALGSKPGAPGNAVIDGHVNNALTTAGVFEHLQTLKLGDTVSVADASGHSISYKVVDIEAYPADTAPADSIFATSGPSELVLITCQGDWVPNEHQFNERLVVFARPI